MNTGEAAVAELGADWTANMHIPEGTNGGSTELTLTSGQIDEPAREYFSQFHCHFLGSAMAELTGWDQAVVEVWLDGRWQTVHSGVLTPAGRVLDIVGDRSRDEIEQHYRSANAGAETRVRAMPTSEVPGLFDDPKHGDPHWWTRAIPDHLQPVYRHFARLVLARGGWDQHRQVSPAATPQPTETATKGRAMNVDEIRVVIAEVNERVSTAAGQLHTVRGELDEAAGLLAQLSQGSNAAELSDALGQLRALSDELEQAGQRAITTGESALSYAGRL